jgi:ABC-type multidrug transport system ATPase subunit
MTSEPILSVEGLHRRFGAHEVLRDVHLDVEPGERIAVTGPNGSGKTTLLRCVAGTVAPSSGTVRVAGHEAGSLGARWNLGVSLSQERSFYMRLDGWENLLFYARLRAPSKAEAARRVRSVVDELEIGAIAAERADRCSTGMLQQLGLARALLGEPPLLLLDEPTRSLDSGAMERFWAALERRPQTAVLLPTHRPDDIERCDRRFAIGS